MLFAHDTEVALVAAAALVNTAHGTDELATQQDLDRFLDFWQFTGARTHDVSELRAVQELLGHAHITTTQVYTQLDHQHLARIYDAAHPRAKK